MRCWRVEGRCPSTCATYRGKPSGPRSSSSTVRRKPERWRSVARRRTLHVNAESVLVEVVDDAGRPVAPGQSGRVVVTPFGSTPMPLIRYDQGDIVVAGMCMSVRTMPPDHQRDFGS